jgi:hypothetical protein
MLHYYEEKIAPSQDAAAQTDHEERKRHLLYAAMICALELLWKSCAWQPSPFLARWVDANKEEPGVFSWQLKKGLMHCLLAGQVRVQTTADLGTEPASET